MPKDEMIEIWDRGDGTFGHHVRGNYMGHPGRGYASDLVGREASVHMRFAPTPPTEQPQEPVCEDCERGATHICQCCGENKCRDHMVMDVITCVSCWEGRDERNFVL